MEPAPPPITIVDPNAPAGTADLLDHGPERDPWRPTRTQVVVTGALLALAGLAGGGVAAWRHVQHERALDRQVLRELRINVSVAEPDVGLFPDFPPGSVQLNVFNDGPSMVRVRTVQLDDREPVPVTTGWDVVPDAATSLTLDLTGSCTANAGRSTHRVTLRLTTSRGQRVTRTLAVNPNEFLNTHERQRCGTLTPTEALVATLVSARTQGQWVQADLEVSNTSVLPLSVMAVDVPAGLQARLPALPLVLPPASAPGTTGRTVRVHLELRVRDCDAFNTGLYSSDRSGDPLTVRLHGSLEDATGSLPLQPHQETGFGVDAPDALLRLMQFCPNQFFG